MNPRLPYVARADGWVAGHRVTRGETVMLSPTEARFEPVDPLPPEPAPQPAKPAPRRRRKVAP